MWLLYFQPWKVHVSKRNTIYKRTNIILYSFIGQLFILNRLYLHIFNSVGVLLANWNVVKWLHVCRHLDYTLATESLLACLQQPEGFANGLIKDLFLSNGLVMFLIAWSSFRNAPFFYLIYMNVFAMNAYHDVKKSSSINHNAF